MSHIGTKFILAEKFTFDPLSNTLIDKEDSEEIIRLGSNESRILWLLAQRPNEVISRNDLHDFVWREQGFEVDDSSLTQAISTLRKMLKDSTKSPQYVKTVPKRGYQLIARVETVEELKKRWLAKAKLLMTSLSQNLSMNTQSQAVCLHQPL
ncbi:cholera toxin transcriptional activator [Vibrio cholerae]|nr:cholera toxin transcriptional activator [Vibrio cholerae]